VKFSTILKTLPCEIIAKGRNFDSRIISNAVVSDMMSEVLTTDKEEIVLITQLSSAQVIRTTDSVGGVGVIIANGTPIQAGLKELAETLGITVLHTTTPSFETCVAIGKLLEKK
jgi:hypothetical protein